MDTRQRAIPTRYGGFRFRSMLEARWAVFFDALDIKYLYEPQGFVTDGKPYLPDFCLLLGDMVWAEVKPAFDADEEGVERWYSFVRGRGDLGVLLTDMRGSPGPFLYLGRQSRHDEPSEYWAQWGACANGYHFQPVPTDGYLLCGDCSAGGMPVAYLDDGYRHYKIEAAYTRARSYQFDRR